MYAIDIICTEPGHPINPRLLEWARRVSGMAQVSIHRNASTLQGGDFLFLVSCHQIIGPNIRRPYRHTLVLHASALPQGRGMSPHIWQVLEGHNQITLSLLNAEDALDSGDIWHQLPINLDGTELYDEINDKLFDAEIALMDWAVAHCDSTQPRPQSGEPSYYRKRTPQDSRIDPQLPLSQHFELLRVADPNRYPAFFEYRGATYRLSIERMSDRDDS